MLSQDASQQACVMLFLPECFAFIGLNQKEVLPLADQSAASATPFSNLSVPCGTSLTGMHENVSGSVTHI